MKCLRLCLRQLSKAQRKEYLLCRSHRRCRLIPGLGEDLLEKGRDPQVFLPGKSKARSKAQKLLVQQDRKDGAQLKRFSIHRPRLYVYWLH